ncbi:unnamed protein product, partial [marine sediment metagenome]
MAKQRLPLYYGGVLKVKSLTVTGAVAVGGTLSVTSHTVLTAGARLYFDGGGDTYMIESSADTLKTYVGSTNVLTLVAANSTFGTNITS